MKIAIVGATGMVGRIMLDILSKKKFPLTELILVASNRSIGKIISFKNKDYSIVGIKKAIELKPDIALFSAGAKISIEWAPLFANNGTTVIDNSSAWRMDPKKKLIIPEINSSALNEKDKIISNPNCSTIQLLMVLAPLHKKYEINRIIISTYQSITGSGVKAVNQLENEYNNKKGEMAYHYPIHKNAIPHCDDFTKNGYTKEEMKLVNETHKILSDKTIGISATAVRIPVVGGHSESVNVELKKSASVKGIQKLLNKESGVIVKDDPITNTYPMPIYAEGKDDVFVGRIRKDHSLSNTFNFWIVADNLRKGAATNTIQIAEFIISKRWK
tara:strand:+ start:1075 stop:2064 length:990 start_codon:yes stop_codon:yes gene_type:complete